MRQYLLQKKIGKKNSQGGDWQNFTRVVGVVVGTPSAGNRRLSSLSTLSLSFHSTRNGGLETPTPDVGG